MKKIKNIIGKIINVFMVSFLIIIITFAIVQKSSDNNGSIGGIKIFTVISGSMIPVYNVGDILIAKEVMPEEIQVGDDIVYKGEKGSYTNKTITHRVVKIEQKEDGNYTIITKGVANPGQDPIIDQTQVYGKIIGKVPIISFILKIITNIYVWVIGIPAIIIIKHNIKRIKNMDVEKGQE